MFFIEGPIPPELGRLGALVKLEVPNNELSGELFYNQHAVSTNETACVLPSTFVSRSSHAPQATSLFLGIPNILIAWTWVFTGLIPPELGTLRSLEVLRLVNNKFDGESRIK